MEGFADREDATTSLYAIVDFLAFCLQSTVFFYSLMHLYIGENHERDYMQVVLKEQIHL